MEEELSSLKDDLVDTFHYYFEQVKKHVIVLYPDQDLIQMGLFKVVRRGQLVKEEESSPY